MTTPLLDFAALTAPIDGEQPAGVRLPADVRKKMEDARKDFEPHPDDPSAAPVPKKPDWPAIVRLATDALGGTSKDLLAAVRLVEALAQRDHFAGLRDGLTLLRMLLTDCWDRVHPLIEEPDDLEYRAGPLQWLSDAESGAWFPTTIAKLPLLKIGGQRACLQDCRDGQLDGQPLSSDAMRNAEPAEPEVRADVAECLRELDALDQALVEKMGQQAPALGSLRDVLNDCARYLDRLDTGPSAETVEVSSDGNGSSEAVVAKSSGGGTNRAETYRQLARLADDLARMEPHSPIPDLLRWAVKLGAMPFRELIQELVREPAVLEDIRRQLGIKEEPPPE
jgi:type VI secretion system protein ImpA